MPSSEDRAFLTRTIETSIRVGLIALLVFWCFLVVRPFIQPIVWGVILAIAIQPAYRVRRANLRARRFRR